MAIGTFAQPVDDRMANLWMYAVNRYGMAIQALGGPQYVKSLADKLGLDYPGADTHSFDPTPKMSLRPAQ